MLDKLREIEARFEELTAQLADPEVIGDPDRYSAINKERSDLEEVVDTFRRYQTLQDELRQARELAGDSDPEMREMARVELEEGEVHITELESELQRLLTPTDPNDKKNVILEIRAGTGGDEAGLFAADLLKMYLRYAEQMRWKVELMEKSDSGLGGVKEVIAMVKGKRVYGALKYESGVHRVQRVPATETQGRIHTSAASVAVLPEVDDVEVDLNDSEVRVDVYRSSGAGGQHVNTTDSAIRLTHLPTGIVVTCQDEKSQHKNKAKAMKILKARIYDRMLAEQQQAIASERKAMVGSGDRSEKIRTYNYPQNRVTDHRIGLTLHSLNKVMEGELEPVITALQTHYQLEAMKGETESRAG